MIRSRPTRNTARMQRHTTMFAGLPLVLLFAATASHPMEGLAQGAADRAAAVLAEARKALGGEERLAAVKAIRAAGEFRRSMGEMQMDGELEILLETPDKLRRNED